AQERHKSCETEGQSSKVLRPYGQIPSRYQDNEFIHRGYRPETNPTHACFSSWLHLHNETVNIYSHLIPSLSSLIAGSLLYKVLKADYPDATIEDHLRSRVCDSQLSSIHFQIIRSTCIWLQLDFVRIIVLTLGDFISGIDMTFYCEPTLKHKYWTMVSPPTLNLLAVMVLLSPQTQAPQWRTLRVATFVGTGLSGIVPIAHGIKTFGLDQMTKQSGMLYYIFEGLLLLLGAFFYMVGLEPFSEEQFLTGLDANTRISRTGTI
ncbi:hemolysin-III channel protein Izh2, partial [Penicillium argentinense]